MTPVVGTQCPSTDIKRSSFLDISIDQLSVVQSKVKQSNLKLSNTFLNQANKYSIPRIEPCALSSLLPSPPSPLSSPPHQTIKVPVPLSAQWNVKVKDSLLATIAVGSIANVARERHVTNSLKPAVFIADIQRTN